MPTFLRISRLVPLLGLSWMLGASPVQAADDVLVLVNGDRITGTISRIWDGEVFIEPSYADEFAVEIEAIQQLISDRRFEIRIGREPTEVGRLESDDAGAFVLVTESGRRPIALADIEELDELIEGWEWEVRTDLSLNGSDGNSNDSNLTWQSYGRLENSDHRHELDLRIDRASRDGVQSTDRTQARYIYSWFISDNWFVQTGANAERDPVRDLARRIRAGAGLGRQFINTSETNFEVTLAAVGIDEELGGDTSQSLAAQWTTRFSQDLLAGDLEFFHENSISAYLAGRDTTLIETSTGFRWDVWGDIYFNTQLDWDYETNPAEGARNADTRYTVGIGVELD